MAKKKKTTKKTTKKSSGSTYPSALSVAKPSAIAAFVPGTYTSKYGAQIDAALNNVTNFKYDPLQDASYQALAKVYGARGNIAAKDTLADAAALNGGMQTSYAVSAAQQARNQYNQELAAMIPELEANAYNRAQTTYNALRDADDTAYGRFRDTEGDRQWKYGMDYDAYRDKMSDYQFGLNYNYQLSRDKVADSQWAKEYALSKKGSSGGGGGGGRRSSGGGGSYSGSTTSGSGMPISRGEYASTQANIQLAQERGKKMTEYYKNQGKKKTGSAGGSGKRVAMTR